MGRDEPKVENADGKKPKHPHRGIKKRGRIDEKVKLSISQAEEFLKDSLKPATLLGLNRYQTKEIQRYFEKNQEYKTKTYRKDDGVVLKVFPVGMLKRLTEQKTQEVLMKGKSEVLPPMGAFERFIVHDYLKDREGVRTESFGEGKERHVEIHPLFGRNPKKAKRKLTR